MAFFGKSFMFNSVPCETYDLMMYNIGSTKQGDGQFASIPTIEEEAVGKKWKPYFYGVRFENKLELDMVFGVNQRRLDEGKYLDRYELDEIASWLTGHEEYLWLDVEQEDMLHVRYKVICQKLDIVDYEMIPMALKASFVCDSPYGYLAEEIYTYTISGTRNISFFNKSCINGYFMPELEITQTGGTFSITNATDGNRVFSLTSYPSSVSSIQVDNEHGIITNNQDLNLYPYFNYKFFRLKRGYNQLTVRGNGTLKIRCTFPVNTGG